MVDVMSKENKKKVREKFRNAVFERDGNKCRVCRATPISGVPIETFLDSHHICPREKMPSGGYCAENGISLCAKCHLMAEAYYMAGTIIEGFLPEDLYKLIGSSYEKAYEASLRLK